MATVRKRKDFNFKVLSRNSDEYKRETKLDIHKEPLNPDPYLHPHTHDREYVRALNATKLERVFAKPFICGLEGHRDTVEAVAKFPTRLSHVLSGAGDGEIRVWDLSTKKCRSTVQAHDGLVRGLCAHRSGDFFLSCGQDANIRYWAVSVDGIISAEPVRTILYKGVYQSIDHHEKEDIFAACGHSLDIWTGERSQPYQSYSWGIDSIYHVKFNRIETHLLAAAADDRSVMLYDTRGSSGVQKLIMHMRTNAIAWNPMQSYMFTCATEDYNLYTYDIRHLNKAAFKHEDHVAAVTDVDFSPTGKEFVTAGYDNCIRIYDHTQVHSRDVYHTKRMQRVNHILWSMDNKYIVSGSDEMNLRLWKARASEKLGLLKPREKAAFSTNEALKKMYEVHPEVKRISRHRTVPRRVYTQTNELRIIKESKKRKLKNRILYSKKGTVETVPEKEKQVVEVQK